MEQLTLEPDILRFFQSLFLRVISRVFSHYIFIETAINLRESVTHRRLALHQCFIFTHLLPMAVNNGSFRGHIL